MQTLRMLSKLLIVLAFAVTPAVPVGFGNDRILVQDEKYPEGGDRDKTGTRACPKCDMARRRLFL